MRATLQSTFSRDSSGFSTSFNWPRTRECGSTRTSPTGSATSPCVLSSVPRDWNELTGAKAKGACATPKRVKLALPLCEQMLWFHAKCGYKPLLDQVCQSKLGKAESERQAVDSSVILVRRFVYDLKRSL
jgi:hypothetical protein